MKKKNRSANIIKRLAVAVALAIPFMFVGFAVILVALWGGGGRQLEFNTTGVPFTIVNNSSVPLRASARLAYTPGELEDLRHQGIDIDLTENFITCNDILIPNEGTDYEKSYSFTIPIPRYNPSVEWPSGLRITLTDSLTNREVWLRTGDIDSTMRARMQIVVTDSMLQATPEILFKEHVPWQRKGGRR